MNQHKRRTATRMARADNNPGATETDPTVEHYLRKPYDPVIGPQMAARTIGLLIRRFFQRMRGR